MPVGEHESVPVGPFGVGGVMVQHPIPEHLSNVCHAHWRARVAAVRGLHRVHCKDADGVGQFSLRGHKNSGFAGRRVLSAKQRKSANFAENDDY